MRYAASACRWVAEQHPDSWSQKQKSLNLTNPSEIEQWENTAKQMYFPKMEGSRIFLQQDGFLDKVLMNASDLPANERPINQHWSWDRILRSVFIKQADTLQGLYLFESDFDLETIKDNFDFYEPKTVHESSLSPCVHCVIAAKLGYEEKAYEMYLRTSRLDLDDYNHEAHEGLHITSMAGTWMSIVEGFGGMRVLDDILEFNVLLPAKWRSYSFNVLFRGVKLRVDVSQQGIEVRNLGNSDLKIKLYEQNLTLLANGAVRSPLPADLVN